MKKSLCFWRQDGILTTRLQLLQPEIPGSSQARIERGETFPRRSHGRLFEMIVFAHVPKTAGTSITGVLMRYLTSVNVPASQMLLYGVRIPYTDLEPLGNLPGEVRLLSGHFRAPHYEKLLACDPFIVGSTRDAFERFCSGLEHIQRLRSSNEFYALPEMLEKGGRLLDQLSEARGDHAAVREALMQYRHVERRGSRRYLVHEDRFVAKARIESTEVDRLCEGLAEATPSVPDLLQTLRSVNQQNIWPKCYFDSYAEDDLATLRTCFEECFDDEVQLTAAFRREIRSVFEPDLWQTFLEGLRPTQTN